VSGPRSAPATLPWARVVLPFAGAYFLSYLFRTVNAVVGPVLSRELSLSASGIGLLTGAYFLAFALAQLPLGVLLDRFGARRVEASLLVVGAVGALAFAAGRALWSLAAARALIGLGVSACLMAAFKAFSQWFPSDRQASLTGWIMVAGGLGSLAASAPLEAALAQVGWRPIFAGLGAATLAAAAGIFLGVPDRADSAAPEPLAAQWRGIATVFRSGHFWRVAPLALTVTGGFMAVQGLWSVSWLMEVNGHGRAEAAAHLAAMAVAMLFSYLLIGLGASALQRRRVRSTHLIGAGVGLSLLLLFAIVVELSPRTRLLWVAYGAFSGFGTLVFSEAARGFPVALSGRANTALNQLVFVGAFGFQWGIGALIDVLRAAGHGVAAAHRVAFALLLGLQGLAWTWFVVARRRAVAPGGPPAGEA